VGGEGGDASGGAQELFKKKYQIKLGTVGLESERVLIETVADLDERLVGFSIVQQTFHGGWKVVIEVEVRSGTVCRCRHGRSCGRGGEAVEAMSSADAVETAYNTILDEMIASWDIERGRWESE